MAAAKKVAVSKKQVEDAQLMWKNFTIALKYCSIATAIILIGLALGFVKFF